MLARGRERACSSCLGLACKKSLVTERERHLRSISGGSQGGRCFAKSFLIVALAVNPRRRWAIHGQGEMEAGPIERDKLRKDWCGP